MILRRATPEDAAELTRLRHVIFTAVGPAPHGPWLERCRDALADRLAHDPSLAAYVVDGGAARLLSCAIGTVAPLLPGPRTDAARVGRIDSVATDPTHQRQGFARACTLSLTRWLTAQGCAFVELRSAAHAIPLYAALGFRPAPGTLMQWRPPPALPSAEPVERAGLGGAEEGG